MIKITTRAGGITFAVRVQPRASRTEITGEMEGTVKLRLAAPPVDGAANDELVRFLAKRFGVARHQVEILSGATSKNKIVQINGISREQAESIFAEAIG